ncbi:MAG: hypothetical protein RSB85_04550 [Rikenellaceae bacterium]
MKKYFSMALLVVAGLCITSCDSDDNNENNGGDIRDINVTAISALGLYQEDFIDDGTDIFLITLANVKISGQINDPIIAGKGEIVFVQLMANTKELGELPVGTYKVVIAKSDFKDGACLGEFCGYLTTNEDGTPNKDNKSFQSGTITIARTGSTYTVSVDVVLSNKLTLTASYEGEIEFMPVFESTLTKDQVVDVAGYPGTVDFFTNPRTDDGNKTPIPANIWYFHTMKMIASGQENEPNTDAIILYLLAPDNFIFTDGMPVGTYTIKDEYEAGQYIALPGSKSTDGQNNLLHSWYLHFPADREAALGGTPLVSGTVKVSKEGDIYTIELDGLDDAFPVQHKVTGTWTGKVTYTNQGEMKAAAKVSMFVPTPFLDRAF